MGRTVTRLAGTFIDRWYVTLFGLSFLWFAIRHMGWKRTLVYTIAAVGVGIAAENGSVHLGFPYTRYAFDESLRAGELWVWDVPLMVPLSYTFVVYFAFAAGRMVASGPWSTRARRPWTELVMAELLAVWSLFVIDPVSRLGELFYLGPLFAYEGPGFWFGLPLGSQLGFALTSGILIAVLGWLTRRDPRLPVTPRNHPHLAALITYVVQLAHMGVVAFVVGRPDIGGASLVVFLPIAVAVGIGWANSRPHEATVG